MKEIKITTPIEKTFTNEDIKEISDWNDTDKDDPEVYLYIMRMGPVTVPSLYIKLANVANAPVATNLSIEDL